MYVCVCACCFDSTDSSLKNILVVIRAERQAANQRTRIARDPAHSP